MPPSDVSVPAAPGQGPVRGGLDRLREVYDGAPIPLKALILLFCSVLVIVASPLLAPYAIVTASRSIWATASVAVAGLIAVGLWGPADAGPRIAFVVPVLIAAFAAHAGVLGRWAAPCRTVGWVLLLALVPGMLCYQLIGGGQSIADGPLITWLLAFVVLGWRLAKAWQDSRQDSRMQQVRGRGRPRRRPGRHSRWRQGPTGRPASPPRARASLVAAPGRRRARRGQSPGLPLPGYPRPAGPGGRPSRRPAPPRPSTAPSTRPGPSCR